MIVVGSRNDLPNRLNEKGFRFAAAVPASGLYWGRSETARGWAFHDPIRRRGGVSGGWLHTGSAVGAVQTNRISHLDCPGLGHLDCAALWPPAVYRLGGQVSASRWNCHCDQGQHGQCHPAHAAVDERPRGSHEERPGSGARQDCRGDSRHNGDDVPSHNRYCRPERPWQSRHA